MVAACHAKKLQRISYSRDVPGKGSMEYTGITFSFVHLQEILKVAPISTMKKDGKSLQIKGCQGKGTDFLITSVLWDCWSFSKKEMKELCSCVGQSRKPWGSIASSEFFLLPVFYIPHRNGSLG